MTGRALTATTLDGALRSAAAAHPDATTTYPGTGEELSLAELDRASASRAAQLRSFGIGLGDVVGLVHGTCAAFLVDLFGVVRSGAAASVLPVPGRAADSARVVAQISRIAEISGMSGMIVEGGGGGVREAFAEACPDVTLLPGVQEHRTGALPEISPGDLAVVQFTSGTTGRPKGVMLSHRAVLAGLEAILVSASFTRQDVLVQWIPTYHDMGLFGLLSQVLNGASPHVVDPLSFLRDPVRLLRYMTDHGCTITTGPNFAYDLFAEAVTKRGGDDVDLGRMRLVFNGSEPVSARTVAEFGSVLGQRGCPAEAMYPVYGMAEATLAVTFPPPGRPAAVVHVDRARTAEGTRVELVEAEHADAKALVSVGSPVHGMEVRVVDAFGNSLGEQVVGEVQIRGDAVTDGYYRDPKATQAAFDGDWFRTGDQGFFLGGELFVVGRRKEMVIVYGRNFFPEDAEAAAGAVPGVHRGRCVAFRVDGQGQESLGVVVETALAPSEHDDLCRLVRQRVSEALGLGDVVVHAVRPGWVTRTTSGKPQRLAAARRISTEAAMERAG